MKTFVGGAIAVLLGVFSFSVFFTSFLNLLAASIPVLLIMGGALTIYLNLDSLKSGDEEEADAAEDVEIQEAQVVEEPVVEEPVAEEPVAEEPVAEEPVAEEPVAEEPVAEEPVAEEAGGVDLVGNTESMVFHTADCKFSKSKKCTANFTNREDAIQDGYKPCGVCKP